jgi:hypothetical protein
MGHRTEERADEPVTPRVRRRRRSARPWYRTRKFRRRVRRVLLWFGIAIAAYAVVCAICSVVVAPTVWRAARDSRTSLLEGSAAIVRKDGPVARTEFVAAKELFSRAERRLRSPLTAPLRIVPVLSTHVRVASSLSRIGVRVADAGTSVADTMQQLPDQELVVSGGRLNLDLLRVAGRALDIGVRAAPEITREIEDMPRGWVGGPLTTPRRQAVELLPSILDGMRKADAALSGLPSLLGQGSTKRYVVAFSNLSELRGSGGLFGYITALRATDGDLDLEDLAGRPTEILPAPGEAGLVYPPWFPTDLRTQARIFQNINMTTDFPTVGGFVLKTAEARAKAGQFDGVISVDPVGVGAVLALTGPIRVPGWPQLIGTRNVAKIAMHDAYIALPDLRKREAFFGDLVRTAFNRLVTATIRLQPKTIGTFDLAVRGGHFRMFSEHSKDQAVIDAMGASGSLRRASDATDVLSVVSENAGGNKIDWFLRRDVRYNVKLDPDTGRAFGALSVTFRNTSPSIGLPDYIIGAVVPGLAKGTNRQIAMVVRGPGDRLKSLQVDGRDVVHTDGAELNLAAYRTTVDVVAQGRSQLSSTSEIPHAFFGEGNHRVYRLRVLRQATARPDFMQVAVAAPAGWEVSGETRFLGDLTQDLVLEVHVRRTVRTSVIDTLVLDPLRLAGRVLGRIF